MSKLEDEINAKMDEAERKAWDSLSRYKFIMYGYWVAVWQHLNQCTGSLRRNPWAGLVKIAREHMEAKE